MYKSWNQKGYQHTGITVQGLGDEPGAKVRMTKSSPVSLESCWATKQKTPWSEILDQAMATVVGTPEASSSR